MVAFARNRNDLIANLSFKQLILYRIFNSISCAKFVLFYTMHLKLFLTLIITRFELGLDDRMRSSGDGMTVSAALMLSGENGTNNPDVLVGMAVS